MTTRAQQFTDRSLFDLGIGTAVHDRPSSPGPWSPTKDEGRRTKDNPGPSLSFRRQLRADRVLAQIAGQLRNQQGQANATFCCSVVVTFDLDQLAEKFGLPVRALLRACTRALRFDLIPPTCTVTSDHTLRCLLVPARPQDNSTEPTAKAGTVPE